MINTDADITKKAEKPYTEKEKETEPEIRIPEPPVPNRAFTEMKAENTDKTGKTDKREETVR